MKDLKDLNLLRQFEELIRNIVRQEIAKAQFNRMVGATVTAVDVGTGNLTVQLNDDGISISGVLNRTGETIIANDEVFILKINNSDSNFVATIKK